MKKTTREPVTDEQMEEEIAALEKEPETKIGRAVVNARTRGRTERDKRRQRLYTLRYFNRIGKEAKAAEDPESVF